jgi:hypothetical protein
MKCIGCDNGIQDEAYTYVFWKILPNGFQMLGISCDDSECAEKVKIDHAPVVGMKASILSQGD